MLDVVSWSFRQLQVKQASSSVVFFWRNLSFLNETPSLTTEKFITDMLQMWWQYQSGGNRYLCITCRREQMLASRMLCVCNLQQSIGRFDLFFQGWSHLLWKALCRAVQASLCCLWWSKSWSSSCLIIMIFLGTGVGQRTARAATPELVHCPLYIFFFLVYLISFLWLLPTVEGKATYVIVITEWV